MSAAVLYDGSMNSTGWQDLLGWLSQPVVIGLQTEAVDVNGEYDLSAYDFVIPDGALAASPAMEQLRDEIVSYTENGGYVLLDNRFHAVMPKDYLGISEITAPAGSADIYAYTCSLTAFPPLSHAYLASGTRTSEISIDVQSLIPPKRIAVFLSQLLAM